MKSYKKVLMVLILAISNSVYANYFDQLQSIEKINLNICYFSLNNDKEFGVTRDFVKNINISKTYNISVHEFQSDGSSPEDSFKAMIETGVRCDGLVISGHHTGSFGGKRANGELSIDFLEGLNCNEKYYKWFSQVKALWLQGCRTLGAKIETNQDADSNALRVFNVREEDHLQQDRGQLAIEFSQIFDEENPLSKRYLRIFPEATTFGWTKTAPGEKWGSEKSVVYHFANILKLHHKDGAEVNPFDENMTKENKALYSDQLIRMLSRNDLCDEEKQICYENEEEYYKQAWINHGHEEKFTYAYMNKDLFAYPSLNSTPEKDFLDKARVYSCDIREREKKDLPRITLTVDKMLGSLEMIGLSFNALYELYLDFETFDIYDFFPLLTKKLEQSQNLHDFLLLKLKSDSLSLSRKMDYFSLYKKITNIDQEENRQAIKKAALKILLMPQVSAKITDDTEEANRISNQNIAINEYKQATIQSLVRNKIYKDQYEFVKLLNNKDLKANALSVIIKGLAGVEVGQVDNIDTILENLWNHQNRNDDVIEAMIQFLGNYQYEVKSINLILHKIIKMYPLDEDTISRNLYNITDSLSKPSLELDHNIIKKLIIKLSKINTSTYYLTSLFTGIKNYKGQLGDGVDSLKITQQVISYFDDEFYPYQYISYLDAFYYSQIAMNNYTTPGISIMDTILDKFVETKKVVEPYIFGMLFKTGACFTRNFSDYKILKSKFSSLKGYEEKNIESILSGFEYCRDTNQDIIKIIKLEMESKEPEVISEVYSLIEHLDYRSSEMEKYVLESFIKNIANDDVFLPFVIFFPEYLKKMNDSGEFIILDELSKRSGYYEQTFLYLAYIEVFDEDLLPLNISRKSVKNAMDFFKDVFSESIYDLITFEREFIFEVGEKLIILKRSKIITKNQMIQIDKYLAKIEKAKIYL